LIKEKIYAKVVPCNSSRNNIESIWILLEPPTTISMMRFLFVKLEIPWTFSFYDDQRWRAIHSVQLKFILFHFIYHHISSCSTFNPMQNKLNSYLSMHNSNKNNNHKMNLNLIKHNLIMQQGSKTTTTRRTTTHKNFFAIQIILNEKKNENNFILSFFG
jgi:hypothetical protein